MEKKQVKLKKPIYKRWWFIIIVVFVIIGVIGSLNGNDETQNSASNNTNDTNVSDKSKNEDSKPTEDKKETLTNIVLFCEQYNRLSEEKILLPENWADLRKLVEYGII